MPDDVITQIKSETLDSWLEAAAKIYSCISVLHYLKCIDIAERDDLITKFSAIITIGGRAFGSEPTMSFDKFLDGVRDIQDQAADTMDEFAQTVLKQIRKYKKS